MLKNLFDYQDSLAVLNNDGSLQDKLTSIHEVITATFDFIDRIAIAVYEHDTDELKTFIASCHGENGEKLSFENIARYPVYNSEFNRPFTLQDQINICWEEQLDNEPLIYDCAEAVELETFVRNLAKGQTINVEINDKLRTWYDEGKRLYSTRFGQLDMSCKQCHEHYVGQRLRGQVLTQGQSNGFPEYRLGSGRITSLHRRLTECFISFRAEPFEYGSPEFISLELFLHARSNGLKIETPAVRY